MHYTFSPVGVSLAALLTLGWSLSSSSKNSVVPPVNLATPCRSRLQARGPRPRPKHLQRGEIIYMLTHPVAAPHVKHVFLSLGFLGLEPGP